MIISIVFSMQISLCLFLLMRRKCTFPAKEHANRSIFLVLIFSLSVKVIVTKCTGISVISSLVSMGLLPKEIRCIKFVT